MSPLDSRERVPQDLVAIFHASFHPTRGNVVDWSLKASDDLILDNLEFNALPSGLHLVEQDVVYFNKDGHHGVCVFRRRKTTEHGHRGFRLSSLGILLAKSRRPRPWRHTTELKDLIGVIYSKVELSDVLEPTDADWQPARAFFEERKVRRADLGGAGDWNGWSHDLYNFEADPLSPNPTLHLPHLLRILGPSSMTLYKHVLGRRRILILTLPPVQAACILCQVAADLCFEEQVEVTTPETGVSEQDDIPRRLRGRCREGINVLGMITLNDVDRINMESKSGRGWIACTTDAIFLDKPSCYDLLINLTALSPNKPTRPTFHVSRPTQLPPGSKGPTHRLSAIRFAWSDVKLWNEIDRLLQLDSEHGDHHACCGPPGSPGADAKSKFISTWTDAWRVYEDVCIICAGLWMGSWRGNSTMSYSTANGSRDWGSIRLEGDDDLTIGNYVRNVGLGIEGGPNVAGTSGISNTPATPTNRAMKRSSDMSWRTDPSSSALVGNGNGKARASTSALSAGEDESPERRDHQLLTLALLQTFHAHTCFQLSQLESFLPCEPDVTATVYLTPKDLLSFELGPLSTFDARYLEWLAQEYAPGTRVVVKRGWRDLLGIFFGYG